MRAPWTLAFGGAAVLAALFSACSPVTRDFGTGGGSTSTSSSATSTSTSTGMTGPSSSSGGACSPAMSTRACYDGPMGTEGHGACKAGTQTCGTDGMWGACMGEVVPATDDCATAVDESCVGAVVTCKGTALWQQSFGSTLDDEFDGMTFDPAGNLWVAGQVQGPTANGLQGFGSEDVALVGFKGDGTQLFAKSWGTADSEMAGFVRPAPNGDLYIAARFSNALDLGCGSHQALSSSGDGFVARVTEAGACTWFQQLDATNGGQLVGLATDAAGDVMTIGSSSRQIDVRKLAPDGTPIWSKQFGDMMGNNVGIGIAPTPDGGLVVSGAFGGTLDFGGATKKLVALVPNSVDTFIAKLDKDGTGVWALSGGSPTTSFRAAYRLAVDPKDGSIYSGGVVTGSIDFGTGKPISAPMNTSTGFALKLKPDGTPVWLIQLGSGGSDLEAALGVAVDSVGHVIFCGGVGSKLVLGNQTYVNVGKSDAYVVKLDKDGNPIWIQSAGVAGAAQVAFHCGVNDKDEIGVVGIFDTTADWPTISTPLTSVGKQDVFVAKLAP